MSTRLRAAALAVVITVSAGAVLFTASTLISMRAESSDSVQSSHELDPNDCSRGIDEANEETCLDAAGGAK